MNRSLHIDSAEELDDCFVIRNRKEVESFLEKVEGQSRPLILDLRGSSRSALLSLLKFIEDYEGSITAFVKDPVPLSILSRFPNRTKSVFGFIEKPVEFLRLKPMSLDLKDRVQSLWRT